LFAQEEILGSGCDLRAEGKPEQCGQVAELRNYRFEPSMAGSILPYHLRLRDSKVTSSLRINKIQLLRTTGIQILLLRIQPRLGGILEYRHLSILRRSCLTKGLLQRSIIVCNVFQTHRP
jgi:hypothetical protein